MTKHIITMHKVFIILGLIAAFFTGASNEAKREILAMERMEKLSQLSLAELGEVRVNAAL